MRKFDTKVQHLKYKVLREVARQAWNDTLYDNLLDIPKIIVPGNTPTMRCCVYKERAILAERVKNCNGRRYGKTLTLLRLLKLLAKSALSADMKLLTPAAAAWRTAVKMCAVSARCLSMITTLRILIKPNVRSAVPAQECAPIPQ